MSFIVQPVKSFVDFGIAYEKCDISRRQFYIEEKKCKTLMKIISKNHNKKPENQLTEARIARLTARRFKEIDKQLDNVMLAKQLTETYQQTFLAQQLDPIRPRELINKINYLVNMYVNLRNLLKGPPPRLF
jgi:hypothetical protein